MFLFLPLLPPVGHVDVGVDKLGVAVVRVVRPQRLVLDTVGVVGEARRVLEQLVAGQVGGGLPEGVRGQRLRGPGRGVGLVPFSDDLLLPVRVSPPVLKLLRREQSRVDPAGEEESFLLGDN